MGSPPSVWVLLGTGTGGNGQLRSLATALGWPYEAKQLVYGRWSRCPNLLLGATALGIDRAASSPLGPPWPDLVIGGSRRSAPVARWIKRRSGGRARLVHLMHTQAPLEHVDLLVTTPQYRLPVRPNVLHNTLPLNHIDRDRLRAAAAEWAPRFAALPRPYTALLVGGDSSSYVLDAATATALGRLASAQVTSTGGALLLTTSARTPPAAAEALIAAVTCPASCYRWQRDDPRNPYHGLLGLADRFIVTGDSASLAAEACAMEKPVQVFAWPVRPDARSGIKGLLRRWSDACDRRRAGDGTAADAGTRLYDRLVYLGLIKPPRDFPAYHRALRQQGLAALLGDTAALPPRQAIDDMARTVERIRALLAADGCGQPVVDSGRATAVLGPEERTPCHT